MYYKLIGSAFLILVVVVLICCIYVSFSNKNGARIQASYVVLANDQRPDEKSHSGGKDARPNGTSRRVIKQTEDVVRQVENVEYKHMKCLQKLAETTVDMLIASRSVISMNQEVINRDPPIPLLVNWYNTSNEQKIELPYDHFPLILTFKK